MVMRLLPHGAKIGNATVIVDIVQSGNPEIRPGRKMIPKYLTDHDTGNAGRDANAEMHNRYIHNMASYHPRDTTHVSWHLTVDENYIYQHIPFDEIAWHCGDGTGAGNYSSVGVEKCMHINGDRNKIEANGIALHAYLMKALKIPIQNVKPHQAWSGKYCPQLILNKYGSFLPFRNKIEAAFKTGKVGQVSKPAAPLPSNVLGTVEAVTPTLNVRTGPGTSHKILKAIKPGTVYRAYEQRNGWYNLGGNQWVSAGSAYVRFTKNPAYKAPVPKPVTKPEPVPEVIGNSEKDVEKLELVKAQREELAKIFKKARERGVFTSTEHEKSIVAGTMSVSRVLYLQSIIAGAALNGGKRIQ